MNKSIEIQKIKVNNGQELIAKAKEYKNSGGEWKLLERYFTLPSKNEQDKKGWSKRNNLEAIRISDGQQIVDLMVEGNKAVTYFLTDDWDQLKVIFPEVARTTPHNDTVRFSGKEIKVEGKSVFLGRFLNAWSVGDIFKIICDYFKENETEIKKSIASLGLENSLKHWIKVGNDTNGNIFVWLGKRDEENININGGGELQISINRKDLEIYSSARQEWGGFISWKDLDNNQLRHELFERIESFWYTINNGSSKGAISAYDDHQVGFTKISGSNSDLPDKETYPPYVDDSLPSNNEPGKINDNIRRKKPDWYYEFQNLKKIFKEHNIRKITFKNGQLTIEYNNKKKIVNNQEFQELEKYCQEHNESVIDSQKLGIANDNTNSEPNKGNHKLVIGLSVGVGITILIGSIAYFVWKKRNKNKK